MQEIEMHDPFKLLSSILESFYMVIVLDPGRKIVADASACTNGVLQACGVLNGPNLCLDPVGKRKLPLCR
jgi:hypothetical protein